MTLSPKPNPNRAAALPPAELRREDGAAGGVGRDQPTQRGGDQEGGTHCDQARVGVELRLRVRVAVGVRVGVGTVGVWAI